MPNYWLLLTWFNDAARSIRLARCTRCHVMLQNTRLASEPQWVGLY